MTINTSTDPESLIGPDQALSRWCRAIGWSTASLPGLDELRRWLRPSSFRPSARADRLSDWECRHGFALPASLRAWLLISDGFYPMDGPAVHPIAAIGPMVPFAAMPGLLVQPESWFELGNPNETETICIDLGYRWPGGDAPVFASGDDCLGLPPRIIAPSFTSWLLRLVREQGRPYWQDPRFRGLGDPWDAHRRHTQPPPLSGRLRRLLRRIERLHSFDLDDSALASMLGISRFDAETLLRYLQHQGAGSA